MGNSRILFSLAVGARLWAGDPGVEPPPVRSEASATVTVTAEATPVEVVRTPNPVLVVDRAAIEARGADNLGDLLRMLLPGQVFSSGGVGTAATLNLGGGRAQDAVVVLDGIRLSDATGLGGVNLSMISLAGIERMEVQQGPCSTRFGSDAQTGVVALYSAGHAREGFSGQVRAGAGSQAIREGLFAPAYGWASGWVRASVSGQQEDGATPADHPFRSSGVFLGGGQQVGADTLVTASYRNAFAGVPVPITYADYGSGPRAGSQYVPSRQDFNRTEVLSATVRSSLTPALLGELTVGQALQARLEPNYTDGAATERYTSQRNQANGALTWRASRISTLQAGFDLYQETARFAGTVDPATGRHLAVFLEDQTEISDSLRVVATVRGERDRLTFPDARDTQVSRATWKLGINWLLGGGLRAYASAGTAFANPLLFQAIYNAQYQGQALDNERSFTAQAGLTYAAGPWTAALELSRTLYGNLVYFDANGGQFIPASWGGYYSGIYRNGSDLRLQSAQVTAGYRTGTWSLQGFYRNQEFRDEQAVPSQRFSSGAVIRKPFQTLGLTGHRTLGSLRLEGSWSWIGPRYDYGLPTAFKEHFNDLGLKAMLPLGRAVTLTLRGDHLLQPRTTVPQWLARERDFQNDASQIFGFPAQPPTVTVEMRYLF
ncbi:TonB-dependent receptor plug domain-containing protein [Mesoterricola silvestris]|uniref:TonB-dependent receptor n=1 Tax=Mesoterricola silvestris TaxID=2927979 RepID=A0AA48GJI5_9BACT|nr:TonB-dependent receptor [Mesoterricola silvestris]BDU70874.1 TonB-dependent receptor [Mesoterricola silvestris]